MANGKDPTTDIQIRDLNRAARDALAAGRPGEAARLLRQAVALDPGVLSLWLNYAGALRQANDFDGAQEAVNAALRLEPRDFNALMLRASLLDRPGHEIEAARAYGNALLFKPAVPAGTPLATAVERAERVYQDYLASFAEAVDAAVAAVVPEPLTAAETGGANALRFGRITSGRARIFHPEPNQYYYPGLPSQEFYERRLFPWIEAFEAATDDIREELEQALTVHRDRFVPYVNEDDTLPLDQWKDLNGSADWSTLHLIAHGQVAPDAEIFFPRTLSALALAPQPSVPGRSPSAMFSALKPRTRIPPHVGVSNARLVLHLPLIVPENCGFRVGSETRSWKVGTAWVFDDTIEHEAWNDSDALRVILIADIWNVFMTDLDRQVYARVVEGIDRFHGAGAGVAGGGFGL